MNQPSDEQVLAEYLQRDSEFSARYREVAADDVPPELDRAVLAQATSATRALRPKLQTWRRFSMPLALAATLVIAVSVVIQVGQSDRPMQSIAPPAIDEAVSVELRSQPTPAAPMQTAEAIAEPQRSDASESKRVEIVAIKRARAPAQDAAAAIAAVAPEEADRTTTALSAEATAPSPQFADRAAARKMEPALELEEVMVTAQTRTVSSTQGAGPRNTVPNSPAGPSEAQLAKEARESDPAAWLAYIRELRAAGKSRQADREWQRLLKAYPNYPVTETDSARGKN